MTLKTDWAPGDKVNASDLNLNFKKTVYPFFGDGSDGDVVISSNTTLTADMYYDDLTINDGIELKPDGYKIFVRGTLTFLGTGKISAYGGDGGNGGNGAAVNGAGAGTPGSAPTQANTAGTLPASGTSGDGGEGDQNTGGFVPTPGVAGSNSIKAIVSSNGSSGGAAIGGGSGAGGAAGAIGTNTGTPVNPLKTYFDVYNLLDLNDNTIARMDINAGAGSGGGGGIGESPLFYCGGGGGGAGAPGGIAWVSAFKIVTVNGNDYIDVHGGDGGDGGNGGSGASPGGAYGGSGGGGGNGGVAIVIYNEKTGTGTINITLGTKGVKGTGGDGDGNDGNDGIVGENYELQII